VNLQRFRAKAFRAFEPRLCLGQLSIQILEDIKDPRRAHYIFKIRLTGVEAAYQVANPGEKDHSNVDRASWISTFEEALAKAIVQVILSRRAEQASQVTSSQKE
jgi:hypothetical protein